MVGIKDFFNSRSFKVIAALLALLLGIMVYSATTGGYAPAGDSPWGMIVTPFQRLSSSISEKVNSSLDMLGSAEEYYNENQKLKEQINSLYNDMIDYERLKQENNELRTMLDLSSKNEGFTFSPPCTVVSRLVNDPASSFTIDSGTAEGISPGDPAVTADGIVGVCYDVAENNAKVRTLYSPKTAIGVYSLRTNTTGIIEGDYELAKQGLCRMSYIDKASDITEGDIIVTSGSESYPPSQLVGVVQGVYMEDSGLSQYAVIRPAVDPEAVSLVFVITSFSYSDPPAENNAEETAAPVSETQDILPEPVTETVSP